MKVKIKLVEVSCSEAGPGRGRDHLPGGVAHSLPVLHFAVLHHCIEPHSTVVYRRQDSAIQQSLRSCDNIRI